MQENDVVITTQHGRMPAFTACPDQGGPFPAIIFYMDAPGIREELRNMARRIAKMGYYCVLPDMYYRMGRLRFDTARRTDAMSKIITATRNHLSNALVMEDTAGILAVLDAQDAVKTGPVGCVGYCMSGQYITSAAGTFPHRIAAAASLYGVQIVTEEEDSPHLLAGRIKAELYYGFAEHDKLVPENVIPDLSSALDKHGVVYEIETFPDTYHGFCFPERNVYATEASETVWQKLFAMWDRQLR